MKIHTVEANTRVTFYFNDNGFLFYVPDDKKILNRDLRSWEYWKSERAWDLYDSFGFIQRLFDYLYNLPEYYKNRKMYQEIKVYRDKFGYHLS